MPNVDAQVRLNELQEAYNLLQQEVIKLKISMHTLKLENALLKDINDV